MSVEATDPVAERIDKWLGGIPSGWAGARLLEVADAWTSNVDKHTVEGQPPVRLCNYVDVYKNGSIVGSLDFMTATAKREQIKKFRIRVGDTLITKDSETADDIGVPAFVEYEADDLICGYHLAIVRPDLRRVLPKYLYWVLNSEPIARQWGVTAAGVTRVGIRSTDLNKVTMPLPPLDEQQAIADYLDQETAQIDALVAKQEEFIGLLRERRSGIIAAGVTGFGLGEGLDDEETSWLGAPPDGWVRGQVKHFGAVTLGKMLQGSDKGSDVLAPYMRAANVQPDGVLALDDAKSMWFNPRELRSLDLRAGDVVVVEGGIGGYGRAAFVAEPLEGWGFQNSINRIRPFQENDGRYLAYFLIMARQKGFITAYCNIVSMPHLTAEKLEAMPMFLPPPDVQRQIADGLDDQTARIDALIAKAEEHIALAKERHSALITAAVTGQIDMRTARKAS
ncbi:restriction endonuclease subunit S [Nocardiopsis sp. NPDC006832]|uniref:restriction endonuclease subunit S n=1 Tax=Nocardiopsis sp. NPDC006832 TaxID=3157188 RepID=UPI0033EC1B81